MANAYCKSWILAIACVVPTALSSDAETALSSEGKVCTGTLLLQTRKAMQSSNKTTSMVSVALSWETGTVDSGLVVPLKPSFSQNKNGWTPPKSPQGRDCKTGKVSAKNCWPESMGKKYVGNRLHYLSVEKVSWARDGDYVLKIYGDGRSNKDWASRSGGGDWAFRSELSAIQDNYLFHEGDYQYFSMSFWLDKSWDQVGKWSTLIAQWKMSPGHPHAAVRLSNSGDYKLYFKGDKLWKHTEKMDTKHGGRFLGVAKPQAWNDIKIFFKKSRGGDGIAQVWLNGDFAFDHKGKTLLKSGRGYTKWGMYTNIMGERSIYFDAVNFCHSADREECLGGKTMKQWLANGSASPPPSPAPSPPPSPPPPPPQRRRSKSRTAPSPAPSPTSAPAPAPTPAPNAPCPEPSPSNERRAISRYVGRPLKAIAKALKAIAAKTGA